MNTREWTFRLSNVLCFVAGCFGLLGGATALPSVALSGTGDYQSAKNAPESWRQFAANIRSRMHDRLSADDERVRRLNRLLEDHRAAGGRALNIMAKVWVSAVGTVERVEFEDLRADFVAGLQEILIGLDLHNQPPANMLQPVHLVLSLDRAN